MNKYFSIILLSSIIFSQGTICAPGYIQKKRERISERSQRMRQRRGEILQRRQEQRAQRREDDGMTRCLTSTKEIVSTIGTLVALGITIATFIVGIAV